MVTEKDFFEARSASKKSLSKFHKAFFFTFLSTFPWLKLFFLFKNINSNTFGCFCEKIRFWKRFWSDFSSKKQKCIGNFVTTRYPVACSSSIPLILCCTWKQIWLIFWLFLLFLDILTKSSKMAQKVSIFDFFWKLQNFEVF